MQLATPRMPTSTDETGRIKTAGICLPHDVRLVGSGDVGAAEGLDLEVAVDVPQNARLVAGARQNRRLVQEASTREVPAQ